MVDVEKIGRRIAEQRKLVRKISQEKMAEDLGVYQADISNLEKAKKGSGITDLNKLDDIAQYLEYPLETLIFGIGGDSVKKYYGNQMSLKASKKKPLKAHLKVLTRLLGYPEEQLQNLPIYECDAYMIYSMIEERSIRADLGQLGSGETKSQTFPIQYLHTYIFYGQELTAVATAAMTTVGHHISAPLYMGMKQIIQDDAIDPADVLSTLNPYWVLWQYPNNDLDMAVNYDLMARRMGDLQTTGMNTPILYIESVYVREDYRQNGIFRLYVDFLKKSFGVDPFIWLNMEPTTGSEMEQEYRLLPSYTVSDMGQLNINAAIAEKVGFTIDPRSCYRQSETLQDDGSITIGTVQVRKYAYLVPRKFRYLLQKDGDALTESRARRDIAMCGGEEAFTRDMKHGPVDGFEVAEYTKRYVAGPRIGQKISIYAAKSRKDAETFKFGVSRRSVVDSGLFHEGQMETYDHLEDAAGSLYLKELTFVYEFLMGNPGEIPDYGESAGDKRESK